MQKIIENYLNNLYQVLNSFPTDVVYKLADDLNTIWQKGNRAYLCGNGGSAGNAIHLANDFNYGINKETGIGMRVEALPANASVITCLANDISYDEIFSQQLKVKGESGDLLIVLSGSGNSPNVINALKIANSLDMNTYAILGYSGGECKNIAKNVIHFEVDDMQISEDMQLVVGHICMQILCKSK